jgi:hypothetical protein
MGQKPETKVVKSIKAMLEREFPGFYFKTHGGLYQMVGLPDLLGVHRGRFIGIEVKCPGKEHTLTENQKKVLGKINLYGGVGFMSTSPEDTKIKLRKEMESWPLPMKSSSSFRKSTERKKSCTRRKTRSTETPLAVHFRSMDL